MGQYIASSVSTLLSVPRVKEAEGSVCSNAGVKLLQRMKEWAREEYQLRVQLCPFNMETGRVYVYACAYLVHSQSE